MKYVQLDAKKQKVLSVFSSVQDIEKWPDFAEVEDDDPRYLDFIDSLSEYLRNQLTA
jgi:hypothetical protein